MLASNINPLFELAPKYKRPQFIKKCINYANKNEIEFWEGWLLLNPIVGRKRRFYKPRVKAMKSIIPALLYYVNIQTLQVHSCIEQLADKCGLSTVSKAGNKSISRACRVLKMFKAYGLIETTNVWDKFLSCWIPTYIELTPMFFQMIGISREEIEKAKILNRPRARFSFVKAEEMETISPTELKRRAKIDHIRKSFQIRKDKMIQKKKIRLKKRLESKTNSQKRNDIAKQILSELSKEDLDNYKNDPSALEKFQRLVNQRAKYYDTIQEPEPPKHLS